MPLTVADLDTLEAYLAGLMHRSDHHAQTVGAVALALIGAVLWGGRTRSQSFGLTTEVPPTSYGSRFLVTDMLWRTIMQRIALNYETARCEALLWPGSTTTRL